MTFSVFDATPENLIEMSIEGIIREMDGLITCLHNDETAHIVEAQIPSIQLMVRRLNQIVDRLVERQQPLSQLRFRQEVGNVVYLR